jgi:hypothetical protein
MVADPAPAETSPLKATQALSPELIANMIWSLAPRLAIVKALVSADPELPEAPPA